MLGGGRGQGDAVAAAGTRGLVQRARGTGSRGVNGGEGGVTGYTRERRVVGWLRGVWRAWVREREAAVRQVVVLVVRQHGCRMVVVVMVEGRACRMTSQSRD